MTIEQLILQEQALRTRYSQSASRRGKLQRQLRDLTAAQASVSPGAKAKRQALITELNEVTALTDKREAAYNTARNQREYAERKANPIPATPRGGLLTEEPYARTPAGQVHSWFKDQFLVQCYGDSRAAERLVENNRYIRAQGKQLRTSIPMNNSDGAGFDAPAWIASQWADVVHAEAPIAGRIPTAEFPSTGTTSRIPVLETGPTTAVQANPGDNVNQTEPTSYDNSVPDAPGFADYVSILGQVDITQQEMDRSNPGIDIVIFDSLSADYGAQKEQQVINGAGAASRQVLGLLTASGTNSVSFTGSDQAALMLLLHKAYSAHWAARKKAPECIVMHPRRVAWLDSATATTLPAFPQGGLSIGSNGEVGVAGTLFGLPLIIDEQIPTLGGAGTNQDSILLLTTSDMRIAEALQSFAFKQIKSADLVTRIQVYGGLFAWTNRRPEGITVVTGSGLTPPSGF